MKYVRGFRIWMIVETLIIAILLVTQFIFMGLLGRNLHSFYLGTSILSTILFYGLILGIKIMAYKTTSNLKNHWLYSEMTVTAFIVVTGIFGIAYVFSMIVFISNAGVLQGILGGEILLIKIYILKLWVCYKAGKEIEAQKFDEIYSMSCKK